MGRAYPSKKHHRADDLRLEGLMDILSIAGMIIPLAVMIAVLEVLIPDVWREWRRERDARKGIVSKV
jgi:hypothetical protein